MTIINVEKQIFTQKRNFDVSVECLTDDSRPITTGKLICILNRNILLDIKEVKDSIVEFNLSIPEYLEKGNEYTLRFSYSGSVQAPPKTTSALLLFNKIYEQRIDAEVIVEDYYCKREDTVQFKSYIKVPSDVEIRGKAVLKLDEQSIGHTAINDNWAYFEFTIPNMILDEHTLLWKYGTNEGIFINTSVLTLEPRIPVVSREYHENNGVTDEIRETLKQPQSNDETVVMNSKDSFADKIRKLF